MRKLMITLITFVSLIMIATLLLYFTSNGFKQFGAQPTGERLERILRSPHYDGTAFVNQYDFTLSFSFSQYMEMAKHWLTGNEIRYPEIEIPVNHLSQFDFDNHSNEDLHFTWLNHSTVLLEVNGIRILTDPVWSERTSPTSIMGPARFHEMPVSLDQLPKIDIVIISHDHYDHLDMEAVVTLATNNVTFLTALGIGAHLESWGINPKQIIELDWWEEYNVNDRFKIACTPAQHFSGRSWVGGGNKTFWSTWAIVGPKHRVFFCGDTGEIPEFEAIGHKYGPFDLTLMKIGAYNDLWKDIHLTPEQTVRLHQILKGKVLLPIHWGSFNLAFHNWNEPIENLMVESQKASIKLATPYPGQRLNIDSLPPIHQWWLKEKSL